jgi:hypothetical protein
MCFGNPPRIRWRLGWPATMTIAMASDEFSPGLDRGAPARPRGGGELRDGHRTGTSGGFFYRARNDDAATGARGACVPLSKILGPGTGEPVESSLPLVFSVRARWAGVPSFTLLGREVLDQSVGESRQCERGHPRGTRRVNRRAEEAESGTGAGGGSSISHRVGGRSSNQRRRESRSMTITTKTKNGGVGQPQAPMPPRPQAHKKGPPFGSPSWCRSCW